MNICKILLQCQADKIIRLAAETELLTDYGK